MRGTLVDRCDNCGAYLRPMRPEQHAAVEVVYTALAEQLDWPVGSGTKRTPWQWHQLMIAAFAEEKGWAPEFLPSLRGGGFTMVTRQKQSRLTTRQADELKHFARAWAIDRGVQIPEPARPEEPPLEAYR